MTRYIPLILFTVVTNAAAQIMLKQGMKGVGPFTFNKSSLHEAIINTIVNPFVLAGLTIFVISMASHLVVLSRVELSFAYPFLSLAYVLVAVCAYIFFKEDLNSFRIAGIGFICIGTILIAQS